MRRIVLDFIGHYSCMFFFYWFSLGANVLQKQVFEVFRLDFAGLSQISTDSHVTHVFYRALQGFPKLLKGVLK